MNVIKIFGKKIVYYLIILKKFNCNWLISIKKIFHLEWFFFLVIANLKNST